MERRLFNGSLLAATVLLVAMAAWSCAGTDQARDTGGVDGAPPVDRFSPDLPAPPLDAAGETRDGGIADAVAETAGDLPAPEEVAADESAGPVYPELPDHAGVPLAIQTAPPKLPFPINLYLRPDEASETGVKIRFDDPFALPEIFVGATGMFSLTKVDLQRMEGFGSMGMIAIPVATPMDPETLPSATDESDALSVYHVTADGLVELPFQVEYQDCTGGKETGIRLLILRPRRAMPELSRMLVTVDRGLTDGAGESFAPYPLAEVLLGLREPYGTAVEQAILAEQRDATAAALTAGQLAPEGLSAAWLFDTGPMESDLIRTTAMLDEEIPELDFDPDGDGKPNVFAAGEYPGVPAGVGIAGVAEGRFKVPSFRDAEGIFQKDETGELIVQGYEWRDFWLILPGALLDQEVPIAFVQHGLNSWKETMIGVGVEYAKRGFVAVGFDFLHHKKDKDGGWDFVIIEKVARMRDNFRQCALDYYAFIHAFKTLAETEIWTLLPMEGGGIDFERIVITGHPLGAIESALTAPLYRGEAIVPLLNAGASLQYLMIGFLKEAGLYDLAPCDMVHGLRVIASHIMSPMDPGIVARYLYESPLEGHPAKPYLLQVGLKDGTVYPETGYELARCLGSPLVEPCQECWPYLPVVAAAETPVGTIQLDGDHQFFFGGDGAAIKEKSRQVYFHFVETGMAAGVPEILWPVE